jgi:phage shock protein C
MDSYEVPNKAVTTATEYLEQTQAHVSQPKPLTRSVTNRQVAGVFGGIGEKFDLDPALLRVAFIVIALITGGVPLISIYGIAAFIIPSASQATATTPYATSELEGIL